MQQVYLKVNINNHDNAAIVDDDDDNNDINDEKSALCKWRWLQTLLNMIIK